MKTSEDARHSGLYASDCCAVELIFIEGDTFWRCPQCQRLCDWELLEPAVSPRDFESLELAEMTVVHRDRNVPRTEKTYRATARE